MVFEWKSGSRINLDANVAGKVCTELEKTVGLTARSLLDASRPENAPLHSAFEWNDSIAAEKHREYQARHIIHSIVVKPEKKEQEPVRAFFALATNPNESARFENITTIIATPEKRNTLLEIAMHELQAFKRKYSTLSSLKPVIDAIDELERTEREA